MNLSDKLADSAVTRQIRLQRYSAGLRNRVISLLEDTATDIIAKLSGAKELTEINRERLVKQLSDIRQLIDKYYQDIAGLNAAELQDLARIEAEWTLKTINTAVGAEIVSAMPSEKVLGELAKDTLIMGAPSAEWWKRQSGDFQFRFVTEMRMGLAQGETNAQLVKRVRGVTDITKRNAEALVRTSAQTVAAEARRATFKENDDVIKGIQQVSTLDGRTTDICIAYSGASWDLEGNPINGTSLPYNGGIPRHWGCRSTEIPITKSFRELGLDIDEFPKGTRSSMDGEVSADLSFADFLKGKSKSFQDDLLGPGRAELWRDGKIALQQLVGGDGNPLTLEQLRKL
jgi:SPP1 gp7 family putative phage head morphogenesis protein